MNHNACGTSPRPDRGDTVQRFTNSARAAAAKVELVDRSAEALATAVSRVSLTANAQRIAIAEAHDISNDLFDVCRKLPGVVKGRSRRELATAEIGVTDALAGIASTGTICVRVDAGFSGYISLLARTHIVVIDPERIVERPGDLFRNECLSGEGLRISFVYITGPSATADMGPLVRGVHGPHFLYILVLV